MSTPEIVTLTSPATGDRARVLVSQGCNLFDYRVNLAGRPVDVLWSLPNFATGAERASSSGIPLLFPFPGRIPGTRFVWEGKTYELEPGDKFGNAIHGFCHTRPWRTLAKQDDTLTAEFQASVDDPSLTARWPADFRISATYEIGAGVLNATYRVDNPSGVPMPCGLGIHPYFRVPLGGSAAAGCSVRLPVTTHWELKDMLPTGVCHAWSRAAEFAAGVPFDKLELDDVFGGLTFANERCTAGIHDLESGHTLALSWDRAFRECVVYTPPHREAICIEPYTCVPGAFGLAERNIDGGLRILAPGESFTARMTLRIT